MSVNKHPIMGVFRGLSPAPGVEDTAGTRWTQTCLHRVDNRDKTNNIVRMNTGKGGKWGDAKKEGRMGVEMGPSAEA